MKPGWLGVTGLIANGIAIVLVLFVFAHDLFTVNWFGIHLTTIAGLFQMYAAVTWFITTGSNLNAQRRKLVIGLFVVALMCYIAGVSLSVAGYFRTQRHPSLVRPQPLRI